MAQEANGHDEPGGPKREKIEIKETEKKRKRGDKKKMGKGKGGTGPKGGSKKGPKAPTPKPQVKTPSKLNAPKVRVRGVRGQAELVELSFEAGWAVGRATAEAAGEKEYWERTGARSMSFDEFDRQMHEANPLPFLPDDWPSWFQ